MISKAIFEQTIRDFFSPIAAHLDDESVSEIMINGPFEIFIERAGKIEKSDAKFESEEALYAALRNLAQYVGRHFDENHPILEGRFPDGSRVEAIIPPAAPAGPSVAIRRFSRSTLTVDRLVEFDSLTSDAAAMLQSIVGGKQNIVVAGGTASGKTSMLNALSGLIDPQERIVVIEDTRELQLQQPHVVPLEAQPPDVRGNGKVTIRDLFKATLRMRPDRIVVGEIRGGESIDLIQAMTSGHGGCMTTVHASHALDTLGRLETMALMSEIQIPLQALRAQIASAADFIVHVTRLADGTRRVTQIAEVAGFSPEHGYKLVDIFTREYDGKDEQGRVLSRLVATGALPACHRQLAHAGHPLPDALYRAAKGLASNPSLS